MAGTYECGQPGSSEPGNIYEFAEDGTLTITRADGIPEPPGTWSVDGDQGILATPDFDEPFTVVDGGFVFEDGSECTKTG